MCKTGIIFAFILFLLSNSNIYSQTDSLNRDSSLGKIPVVKLLKDEKGRGYYEFIEQTVGTKEEIFVRAKQVLYRTYNSGNAVIQMEDKDAGLIEGKGRTQAFYGKQAGLTRNLGNFSYRLTVQTKDNKYRLIFSDFVYEEGGELLLHGGADIAEDFPSNWKHLYKKTEEYWAGLKASAELEIRTIASALDSALNPKVKAANDKW